MPVANSINRKMICGMLMGIETSPTSIPKVPMEKRTDSVNDRLFEHIKVMEYMLINQPSSRIKVHTVASLSLCEFYKICIYKCLKNEQK